MRAYAGSELKRWWPVTVAVVAAAAVAAVALPRDRDAEVVRGGPLACPECDVGVGSPVDARRPFTFGVLELQNRGEETVTLDRLEVLRPSPGLKVLGARVMRARDTSWAFFTTRVGFPPPSLRRFARPLEGWRLEPGRPPQHGAEVLLGLELRRPGTYEFDSIALEYHVGDRRYRAVFDYRFRACAPKKRFLTEAHRCGAPGG